MSDTTQKPLETTLERFARMVVIGGEVAARLLAERAEKIAEAMGECLIIDDGEVAAPTKYALSVSITILPDSGENGKVRAKVSYGVQYKASDEEELKNPAQPDLDLGADRPVPPTPPQAPPPPAAPTGPLQLRGVPLQLARAPFEKVVDAFPEANAVYQCTRCLQSGIMGKDRETHVCQVPPAGAHVVEAEFTTETTPKALPGLPYAWTLDETDTEQVVVLTFAADCPERQALKDYLAFDFILPLTRSYQNLQAELADFCEGYLLVPVWQAGLKLLTEATGGQVAPRVPPAPGVPPPATPFHGTTYAYTTPKDGVQQIGVVKVEATGKYVAAWLKGQSVRRVVDPGMKPGADPIAVQAALNDWADARHLPLWTFPAHT